MSRGTQDLKAILHVFSSDEELKRKALPFVDRESNAVDWAKVLSQKLGNGHTTVVRWARSIWSADSIEQELVWSSFSLDSHLKRIILEALAIRWGVYSKEASCGKI